MKTKRKRKTTRSRTWPETRATLELFEFVSIDPRRNTFKVTGEVSDIGSKGMFLKTSEYVPLPAKADITICFDSGAEAPVFEITAQGAIIRRCSYGVGIRFTSIDLVRLQECIVAKMNNGDTPERTNRGYRLGAARTTGPSNNILRFKDHKARIG